MDHDLVIAIVAALVNLLLSLIIPPLLKNINIPLIKQIRMNYEYNRNTLLISTIIVISFVYISLKITPGVQQHIFSNVAKLANTQQMAAV